MMRLMVLLHDLQNNTFFHAGMPAWKNEKRLFFRSQSIELKWQAMLCIVGNRKDNLRI